MFQYSLHGLTVLSIIGMATFTYFDWLPGVLLTSGIGFLMLRQLYGFSKLKIAAEENGVSVVEYINQMLGDKY